MAVLGKRIDHSWTDGFIYRIDEDPEQSHVYDPKQQGNLEPQLHKLTFASGQRITATGSKIGQSFQRVRELSRHDGKLLEEYAARLQPYR